jgi:parallel beta-helix repeat protein
MKTQIGRVIVWACLGFSLSFGGRAVRAASAIRVPADQPTIQAAISVASNGDTVQVAAGTYVENLNFLGKAIQVVSEQGPEATIIDGNQLGPVVTFSSGENSQSILSGFTLRNGMASGLTSEGGGIRIVGSSPTVTGNIIANNSAGNGGGGIAINSGSPLIQGNVIRNNGQVSNVSGGVGGGGIVVLGAASARILNNTISNNSWYSASGGGISLFAAGTPTIQNNIVSFNSAYSQGGGFYIVNQSDAAIVQNLIVGNSAATGGAVYWLVPSGARGPFLINNTIDANTAPQGSGIFADGFDAQAQIINNIVAPAANQTAIVCGSFDSSVPVFRNNDVLSTPGAAYGGICSNQTGLNGNISADPRFVNAAGGDYHLQTGSPAIDAAFAAGGAPQTDFDGVTRPLDGDGDGLAVPDLGIYEAPILDLIAPVTTAAASPVPGLGGWNITDVAVSLNATDNVAGTGVQNVHYSLSGAQQDNAVIPGNAATATITAEGVTNVSYGATDKAGNVETAKSLTVKVDKTAPVTTAASTPAAGASGWNTTGVSVSLTASDNAAGVQNLSYVVTGAQLGSGVAIGNTATVSITAEGISSVSYGATDKAGNAETSKSLTVKIDKTAPVTTAASTPAAGASGWNTTGVSVSLNASDNPGGSGVQNLSYVLTGAQQGSAVTAGNTASVSVAAEGVTNLGYAAADTAGNLEATRNLVVQIDKTGPVIGGMPAPGCSLSPAKHQLVQVASVTASDALSGLASLTVNASSNEPDSGTGGGDLPGDIVINGGIVQLRVERAPSGHGRTYTIVATAIDVAGNTSTSTATCVVPK